MATQRLTFTDQQISLLSTGLLAGTYSGFLDVDPATGTVTGNITTSPALGSTLPVISASNFTYSFNSATNTTTLTAPGGGPLGLLSTAITYTGQSPATANISISSLGLPVFGATGSAVTAGPVPCFVRGTLIATSDGERPVETLRIGDEVVTASGQTKPILWIGTRSYHPSFVANNKKVQPIRIVAGALDDNLPKRDLFVAPCHAVLIDGILIPAGELINHATVTQADVESQLDYFHIELEDHDCVIAEGVSAETYVDDANRNMFHNADEYYALYPNREDVEPVYAAPRVDDGEELQAVRDRLAARAGFRKSIAA